MTREEIIKLAHKTDCLDPQHYGSIWIDKLQHFANAILASYPKRSDWAGLSVSESLTIIKQNEGKPLEIIEETESILREKNT